MNRRQKRVSASDDSELHFVSSLMTAQMVALHDVHITENQSGVFCHFWSPGAILTLIGTSYTSKSESLVLIRMKLEVNCIT